MKMRPRITMNRVIVLSCILSTLILAQNEEIQNRSLKIFEGDLSCPCLSQEDLPLPPSQAVDIYGYEIEGVDFQTYGIGCASHDLEIIQCQGNDRPDWCQPSWCWVNNTNCSLLNRKSRSFPHRWRSYATCRNIDTYAMAEQVQSLKNRTLRIALNHNSGGWNGAYSSQRENFLGDLDEWSGPTVDFVRMAASELNMTLQPVNTLPEELLRRSQVYFQSSSTFDACIYAASLGFVDLCVAAYFITRVRALSSKFFVMGAMPVRLVIQDDFYGWSDIKLYLESTKTIFEPLEPQTWLFILLFVIPAFGLTIWINEYGKRGSVYPREEHIIELHVDDHNRQIIDLKSRIVPKPLSMYKAGYITGLSVFSGAYTSPMVSIGGKISLLGLSFFMLTIVAVYTANLSTLLVADARFGTVYTINAVVKKAQRICALREVMEEILTIYDLRPEVFLVDPISEGGDGKPGFACRKCNGRQRVLDFLDPERAGAENPGPNATFCHAAIMFEDDLVMTQKSGRHCNKSFVGDILYDQIWGLPIFNGISQELTTFFLNLKIDDALNKILRNAMPSPICTGVEVTVESETSALNMTQLTGIWIVSLGLGFLSLSFICVNRYNQTRQLHRHGRSIHTIYAFDQNGQRMSLLNKFEPDLYKKIHNNLRKLSHDDES